MKRFITFGLPRSQISFGNALAEAISLPIPASLVRIYQREMEFREEQEAFPNEIWERGAGRPRP
jgi:hypothetical protein